MDLLSRLWARLVSSPTYWGWRAVLLGLWWAAKRSFLRQSDTLGQTDPMSMHRHEVTPATRIMLPAYAVFFGWLGLSHIATPIGRLLLAPALRAFHDIVDVRVWGLLFLFVSGALAYAMGRPGSARSRPLAAYVLLMGAIVMGLWMISLIGSFLFAQATPGAAAYAFLPMMACYASYRALTRNG